MSYKSENWKEKLEQVRSHVALKEGSVEKSADDILNDQIEEELATFFVEDEKLDEVTTKMPEKVQNQILDMMNKLMDLPYGSPAFKKLKKEQDALQKKYSVKREEVEEVKEEKLSVERTVEKLTEKNMLGRLSKSLRLDEEGKEKLFNYFDKGELEQ
jgi:alpha-D-ribose 1-methylphosphonate 5-triphosphate diphosphatase PhnM|tara:strand:+ start:1491 stop:1961 length:471 start_codon:yes stop_codon:yes gene_type:complete